jgi:hypothetical protein
VMIPAIHPNHHSNRLGFSGQPLFQCHNHTILPHPPSDNTFHRQNPTCQIRAPRLQAQRRPTSAKNTFFIKFFAAHYDNQL